MNFHPSQRVLARQRRLDRRQIQTYHQAESLKVDWKSEKNFSLSSASETNALFRVTGGSPMSGEITPQGNKNEALAFLAVAWLTHEPVTLENLPAIADVMQQILRTLGVRVENDHGVCTVQAANDPGGDLPAALCAQLRGSVALAGPLLAR